MPELGAEFVSGASGQLAGRLRGYWALNLYPEAAEAGGCLIVPTGRLSRGDRPDPERAEVEAVPRSPIQRVEHMPLRSRVSAATTGSGRRRASAKSRPEEHSGLKGSATSGSWWSRPERVPGHSTRD